MTRGNQREKAREKAAARNAKNAKQEGRSAPKLGGVNSDAERLQAKLEMKKKLKEEGKLQAKDAKDRGDKYVKKDKVASVVNPHTGKKDPKLAAKLAKKGKA
mmetsp:Transcript_5367/g.8314  ORF Transcript_5367/g.8314 Transcript_5367/m.8314 type:complete len:102 (+) Transcript_5367:146-451(+)|eukprot:CAMPEP_0203766256 /NCGR_PEP_ID=MMETSP0099_2-20121227/312_1 /ASSEMBLY_ACC=CAM_ASM_000209 /TAXON_ID=96639 /ORGANISM=" , Strain NY0313808BC1" /LENGTH=101 /DNA_ID=CAMNT_0050662577 /DNA_START=344 /DNA_END=649 /DNA_ORIENTATION=-